MRVARDISTASSKILGEGADEKNFLDGTRHKEDTGPEESASSLSPPTYLPAVPFATCLPIRKTRLCLRV